MTNTMTTNKTTLKFWREDTCITYCGEAPVDRNNPEKASTAIELAFPTGFSKEAKAVLDYLEGTAFLYEYDGRLVVTDESLELTLHADRRSCGAPRWVVDSWEELEQILEENYKELKEEGVI